MIKMHLIALFAFLLAADAVLAVSLPLHIVTWNIRYATTSPDTNEKPWSDRKPKVINLLKETAANATSGAATIIRLQEALNNQLNDIQTGLGSSWAHIGFRRDDGKTSGEYSPILYRTDVFSLVYSEMKWLSQTPDSVSFGWGAGSRRVGTIGVFEYKSTGKRFIHANTHLDNVSSQARSGGIKVVAARVMAVQGMYGPLGVTLTGNFNSAPDGDAYTTGYLTEIWNSGAARIGTNQLTFTGFSDKGISRIDFVWFAPTTDI